MDDYRNPQAKQMADESMIRNLAAQARAIWPQEEVLIRRYEVPAESCILDLGCGTGEIASRLAEILPRATVVGVDLIEGHLCLARKRYPHLTAQMLFVRANAFQLAFEDATFDFSVCRHLLQAVPNAERVLDELVRVTRPGGRLHVIAEDYGMIHMYPTRLDADAFWYEGPSAFGRATGTDLHIGRRTYTLLKALGVRDISLNYISVDTLRVPRETFAAIWEAWRDGYAQAVAEHTRFSREEVLAFFDDMIDCIRNPDGYAVWQVPVLSAVVV